MIFTTAKQKTWLVLVLLLAWGDSNLIARWVEQPGLERSVVLAIGLTVVAMIVAIKPE